MNRALRLSVLVAVVLAALAATRTHADSVDDLIGAEMKAHQIPGLALAVIQDGRPIKTQGYGLANLEWNIPVTPETVFEIGSLSKQFTAACILLLVEDGKLSLDDKISRRLENTPPAWSNITVRHLLTHTSGITNYTGLDGFELTKHLTAVQFTSKFWDFPLAAPPGEVWSYCNTGYNLLGFIIERVSRKSYWDFLSERILKPLDMTATGNRAPGVIIPHRAAGYELTNHVAINRDYDLTDVFSAGAIVSTVVDLTKWDAALNGDKFLSAASREQWWSATKLNSGKIQNYGFGWYVGPWKGHKNIGHGGATSGFSATIQRFPDDKMSLIILCNADEFNVATTLARKLAGLYLVMGADGSAVKEK